MSNGNIPEKTVLSCANIVDMLAILSERGEVKISDFGCISTNYRTITNGVQNMVDEGLVTMRFEQGRKMMHIVSLTEKGEEVAHLCSEARKILRSRWDPPAVFFPRCNPSQSPGLMNASPRSSGSGSSMRTESDPSSSPEDTIDAWSSCSMIAPATSSDILPAFVWRYPSTPLAICSLNQSVPTMTSFVMNVEYVSC